MSEAKENSGASVHDLGRAGRASAISVSNAEFIRLPSGDLCDRCARTNRACSLRCDAHEKNIMVRSCAHYKYNILPIMVVGTNGRVI